MWWLFHSHVINTRPRENWDKRLFAPNSSDDRSAKRHCEAVRRSLLRKKWVFDSNQRVLPNIITFPVFLPQRVPNVYLWESQTNYYHSEPGTDAAEEPLYMTADMSGECHLSPHQSTPEILCLHSLLFHELWGCGGYAGETDRFRVNIASGMTETKRWTDLK